MTTVSDGIKQITRVRFDALCYSRQPHTELITKETEWWEDSRGRVIGTVIFDLIDKDWSWIVLGRDERGLFRGIALDVSIETQEKARIALHQALTKCAMSGEAFPQYDNSGKRHEIMQGHMPEDKLHKNFKFISEGLHHIAARRMIEEVALAFVDIDGNYAKDFQTTGFNARLWELGLFAFLYEQKFNINHSYNRPDFFISKQGYPIAIEATTVNPTAGEESLIPKNKDELDRLRKDYMPIKFGSALYSKLRKKYWLLEHMKGVPLILAVHDFCAEGSMTWSAPSLSNYLYGSLPDWHKTSEGKLIITEHPIIEHTWNNKHIPSGFFKQPDSEYISAVLFSNSMTIAKFNRMGVLAGFGHEEVRMFRRGIRHNFDPNATEGTPFCEEVIIGKYDEKWSDGIELFHNPNALIPISEEFFPDCTHHYFDGQRRTWTPKNSDYIHSSITNVMVIKHDE